MQARPANTPGGGIGTPINTPDPLSKYKWWILGGLALLLAAAAAFLLRKPDGTPSAIAAANAPLPANPRGGAPSYAAQAPATKNASLLDALKEELFAIESERISGTISSRRIQPGEGRAGDCVETRAEAELVKGSQRPSASAFRMLAANNRTDQIPLVERDLFFVMYE